METNKSLNEIEVLLGLKDVDTLPTSQLKVNRLSLELEIKPLSPKAVNEYREEIEGMQELEGNAVLISQACIRPDFNNRELLEKAGCSFGWQFIMRKFQPGEIVHTYQAITRICGFDESSVSEIKNL